MLSALSHIQLFASPWTVAYQTSLPMVFPRQEYWSGVPFPTAGDLPGPGIEPTTLCLLYGQADSLALTPPGMFIRYMREDKL